MSTVPKPHCRLVPPDSDNRARCVCPTVQRDHWKQTFVMVSARCPRHDPRGYAAYMARHAPDSIGPVR